MSCHRESDNTLKEIDSNNNNKIFESVIDVLLVYKQINLKYVAINKPFTYAGHAFQKNDILEIIDDGDKKERTSRLKLKRYNNGNDESCFYLPCYIEGNFSMYRDQLMDEKIRVHEETSDLPVDEINPSTNSDGNIETVSISSDEGIYSWENSIVNSDCYSINQNLRSGDVADGLVPADPGYVTMNSAIKELSETRKDGCIKSTPSEKNHLVESLDERVHRLRRNFATGNTDGMNKRFKNEDDTPNNTYNTRASLHSKLMKSENEYIFLQITSKSQMEDYGTNEVCNLFKFLSIDDCADTVKRQNITGKTLLRYSEEDFKSTLSMNPVEARMIYNYIQCNWRPKLTSTKGNDETRQPCLYTVQEVRKHLETFCYIELAKYTKKYQLDGEMMRLLLLDECLLTCQLSDGCPVLESYEYKDLGLRYREKLL